MSDDPLDVHHELDMDPSSDEEEGDRRGVKVTHRVVDLQAKVEYIPTPPGKLLKPKCELNIKCAVRDVDD